MMSKIGSGLSIQYYCFTTLLLQRAATLPDMEKPFAERILKVAPYKLDSDKYIPRLYKLLEQGVI